MMGNLDMILMQIEIDKRMREHREANKVETVTMSMEMFEKIVGHIECIVQIPITCDRNCDDDCKACFICAIKKDNKEKEIKQ